MDKRKQSTFTDIYKTFLYEFLLSKKNNNFKSQEEYASHLLDNIINISQLNQTISNKIAYSFIVLLDTEGEQYFSNIFAASKNIVRRLEQFNKSIFEYVKDKISTKKEIKASHILNWISKINKPIMLTRSQSSNKPNSVYIYTNNMFKREQTEDIIIGNIFGRTLDMFGEYVKQEHHQLLASSFFVIPISLSDSSGLSQVSAFVFLFPDEKFRPKNINIDEFENILLSCSLFGQFISDNEIKILGERNRVIFGLANLMKLYIHSFGDIYKRLSWNMDIIEDSVLKPFLPEDNLKSIRGISNEIKYFKKEIFEKLDQGISFSNSFLPSTKLNEMIEVFRKENPDIKIKIDLISERTIFIDSNLFELIISTLFDNSTKALSENKEQKLVIITLKYIKDDFDNEEVLDGQEQNLKNIQQITLSDNGIGFDDDIINDVVRTESISKWKKTKSTGMGLYLCRSLLRLFNGSLRVLSVKDSKLNASVEINLEIDN